MTTWNLIKLGGRFYVESLPDDWGDNPDTMLLRRYDAGDFDTVSKIGELMHAALYDLYQCSDALKDGDTFSVDGVALYRCHGVHVLPIVEDV